MRSQRIALGVGSNLKNPLQQLRSVLSYLKKSSIFKVLNVSSIFENAALLPPGAPAEWNKNFLNAVVLCTLEKPVSPEEILQEIKNIEAQMGRIPSERWAPRIIDIDVLYWSFEDYKSDAISIPHQGLFERPFAILPLLEVWPEVRTERPEQIAKWALPWSHAAKGTWYNWTRMVGVLNVTSDSFSDGGKFLEPGALQKQVNKLMDGGADILDVGAESTRPGARTVFEEDEFKALDFALAEINKIRPDILISLDCRKPEVVRRVLEKYKIDFLNDVTGFQNAEMRSLVKNSGCKAFVMHSLSVPPKADEFLSLESDPTEQLTNWWVQRREELMAEGVSAEKLIFDPGIGFGKTKEQSLYILNNLQLFSGVKNDIMVAHSRKSYQTLFSNRPAAERDLETALVTRKLNQAYVQYLRVHDVESQNLALRLR